MRYIIDSSVALKWSLPEVDSDKALLIRDDYRKSQVELLSPDFFPLEVGHALTRAERQGRIAVSQAGQYWTDIMKIGPKLLPFFPLAPRAIAISSTTRIGVYDCLYVALAEREQCELVTADEKLVRKLQPQFPFIKALSAFP